MDDFRSKSYGDGMMQIQAYYGPNNNGSNNFRSYSTSYAATSSVAHHTHVRNNNNITNNKDLEVKKGKEGSSSSSSKIWNFGDPEFQRKKRVASYKMYGVEGKMKGSFRRSFRWLKDRYTRVVYGWW
ncbi:hypothetical protein Scep_007846 [Stephania cephalantha]|uniref:Uncharacterized protein n=1 Tax=Stephania cephalantha TaxID=152367 RepID=A0AAP0KCK3_9MAGN